MPFVFIYLLGLNEHISKSHLKNHSLTFEKLVSFVNRAIYFKNILIGYSRSGW